MGVEAVLEAKIAELAAAAQGLLAAGRLAEAEEILRGLRAASPAHFEVNKQLGVALATRAAFAEAREPLAAAVAVRDDDPVVFNVLSVCAFETGDYAAALAAAESALRLRRTYEPAHNSRGNALLRLGQPEKAAEAFKAALLLAPRDAVNHINLANALEAAEALAEALRSVERAIALDPGIATAHVNRGNILQKLDRHADAVAAYETAVALAPDNVDANWNLSMCRLLLGAYDAGWAGYEWRWRRGARETLPRNFPQPLWLGDAELGGRTVLIHAEQGLGDAIQFARYVPDVAARGGRVVLEAPRPLLGLMRALPGVAELVARGGPLPAFDLHCPLMSLPLALAETQPRGEPGGYLQPDAEALAKWAARLGATDKMRVGLVCSGSPTHGNDARRSLPAERMLEALPGGVDYVLLQKDIREADKAALAKRADVSVWADQIADFRDTAALVAQVSLVISVDTSVAHLAGALGRETWLLLPQNPDWRWGLGGERTPWYPEMRLYRQSKRGDWAAPLQRLRQDLHDRLQPHDLRISA